MKQRQRGVSLIAVALIMAGLAAVVMAALFSMKQERNLFAVGMDKVLKQSGADKAMGQVEQATGTAPAAGATLRRCVIDGKTVFSDTECSDRNPTSKKVVVQETRGIEAPKVPKPDPAASGPQAMRDKMIEKATQ
jgi:hypothetical protein